MSMSKTLTNADFNYIASQSGVEIEIVRSWYKDFMQASTKGRMNKSEFSKYYKMLRYLNDEKLSKITDHVFSCFDKDGNGYLDFSEFLIAYSNTSIGEPRKKLEFVFMFYDKDHNGVLEEKEFLQVVHSMYEFRRKDKKDYPPEKLVRDVFDRIDENGDKKLTKAEFIDGCLRHKHILDLISPFDI